MAKKGTRKHRVGEVICTCKAYPFRHRMMGGKCKGSKFVGKIWSENYGSGECSDCHLCVEEDYQKVCQVMEGQEPPRMCPALQQFLDFESVPVPKSLRRKSWG